MKREELAAKVAALQSRGEIKALGTAMDGDPALRALAEELATNQGVQVETDWTGKRLVRALRNRSEASQVRKNPIRRDEAFVCCHCGLQVEKGGAMVRDHCPRCLRGLHVDQVPGDRAAGCRGVYDPVSVEPKGRAGLVVTWACRRCGRHWQGRAHPDDHLPGGQLPLDTWGSDDRAVVPPLVESPGRTLPQRVLSAIRSEGLWKPGERVVVAVSGGLDSTALLHLLEATQGAHGAQLEVVSIDHGLRPESVGEVATVGRWARELGVPFRALSLDLSPGPNLQARARDARREALLALGADRIATGHHQDDQAETVLLHLLRGAGSQGLRGMQAADPPWVRPLLTVSKHDLENWARAQGLAWMEDPSNPASLRGRMRELMPALDALHGGAGVALSRAARLLAREDVLLETLADAAWETVVREGEAGDTPEMVSLELKALRALDPALQLRLLRRLVQDCPKPVRADQLEAVLNWAAKEGARLPLPGGWALMVKKGHLYAGPTPGSSSRSVPSPPNAEGESQ